MSLVEIGKKRAQINAILKKLEKPTLGGTSKFGGDGNDARYWSSVSRTGAGDRFYAPTLYLSNNENEEQYIDWLNSLTFDENGLHTYVKKDGSSATSLTSLPEAKVISVCFFQL